VLAAPAADLFPTLLPWLAGLLVLVLTGGVVIFVLRRTLRDPGSSGPAEGFTLESLRSMHARGDLTDEEFESAKAAMIGRLKGSDPPDRPRRSPSRPSPPPAAPPDAGERPSEGRPGP